MTTLPADRPAVLKPPADRLLVLDSLLTAIEGLRSEPGEAVHTFNVDAALTQLVGTGVAAVDYKRLLARITRIALCGGIVATTAGASANVPWPAAPRRPGLLASVGSPTGRLNAGGPPPMQLPPVEGLAQAAARYQGRHGPRQSDVHRSGTRSFVFVGNGVETWVSVTYSLFLPRWSAATAHPLSSTLLTGVSNAVAAWIAARTEHHGTALPARPVTMRDLLPYLGGEDAHGTRQVPALRFFLRAFSLSLRVGEGVRPQDAVVVNDDYAFWEPTQSPTHVGASLEESIARLTRENAQLRDTAGTVGD